MGRDGPFRIRAPLTASQSARRAAALKANQDPKQPLAAAVSSATLDEVAVITDSIMPKANDAFLYGPHAAKILSDCTRAVALAPRETKKIAFQEIANKIGEAVVGNDLCSRTLAVR